MGGKSGEATTLNNIGGIYSALGEKQEALEYYNQSFQLFHEVGDIWSERAIRYNIGTICFSLGEYHKAEEQLLIVVQIDKEVGYPDLESARQALELIQQKIAEQERN